MRTIGAATAAASSELLPDGGCQPLSPNPRGQVLEPVAPPSVEGPFSISPE